jgi:transmembrane sensor
MIKRFLAARSLTNRLRTAAHWHLLDERPVKDGNLGAWLKDGGNKQAYEKVDRALALLDSHADSRELSEMRRTARGRLGRASLPIGRTLGWASAVCAAALLLGVVLTNRSLPEKSFAYSTGIGERKTIALDDGSRIMLDSSTSVRVLGFNRHGRALSLVKGRARFDVAHDKTRPFTVRVGQETVIAVGTSFNVEKLHSEVLVTLGEGLVEVKLQTAPGAEQSVWLKPGEELATAKTGTYTIHSVDLRAAEAWQRGQIVLSDRPLDEAIEEVNRYLATPVILDPAVANVKVSGVFNVGDLDNFVDALTSYFPIQATREQGHILLKSRS